MTDKAQRRKQHAHRMFAWEDQVAKDTRLNKQAIALKIVTIIRKRVDADRGDAQIDQFWLARNIGCARSSLQAALKKLEQCGHLTWECRKHLRLPNIYRPSMPGGPGIEKRCPVHMAVDARCTVVNVPGGPGTDSLLDSSRNLTAQRGGAPDGARAAAGKRGTYELEIARRLGNDGTKIVYELMPNSVVSELCRLQSTGTLTQQVLEATALQFRVGVPARDASSRKSAPPPANIRLPPSSAAPPNELLAPAGFWMLQLQGKNWGASASEARALIERFVRARPDRHNEIWELFERARKLNCRGRQRIQRLERWVQNMECKSDFWPRPPTPPISEWESKQWERGLLIAWYEEAGPAVERHVRELAVSSGTKIRTLNSIANCLADAGILLRRRKGVYALAPVPTAKSAGRHT